MNNEHPIFGPDGKPIGFEKAAAKGLLVSIKEAVWRRSTILVLAGVLIWNVLFSFESVKEQLPFLVTMQLWFHQALSYFIPSHSCHLVAVVEIDDAAYATLPISRVTDRSFLGTLIKNAASAGATAIALDFRLVSSAPQPAPGKDLEAFTGQNRDLFEAILDATGQSVPVVLPTALVPGAYRSWKRLPDIFADYQLPLCPPPKGGTLPPGCVALGHINLPIDRRQIALQMEARDWTDSLPLKPYDSLALATVTAHETVIQAPLTRDKIAKELLEFVYGSFAPPSKFLKIPALELIANTDQAKKACSHHIVVIGGVWHTTTGEPVDSFRSPIGDIPGVYFHANYIEALLGSEYQRGVSLWVGIAFDFVASLWLYTAYHRARKPKDQLKVLAVFFFPLLATYVMAANFNRYLDFILPLSLCFVDLGIEHYLGLWRSAKHSREKG